jgi:hypothetical protein
VASLPTPVPVVVFGVQSLLHSLHRKIKMAKIDDSEYDKLMNEMLTRNDYGVDMDSFTEKLYGDEPNGNTENNSTARPRKFRTIRDVKREKKLEKELAPVSTEGLTPQMRAIVESNPTSPTALPPCVPVGCRIELINLVGTEKAWNGQRGIVLNRIIAMHPDNHNIRVWSLEIAFDDPRVTKYTFFGDKVRPVTEEAPKQPIKRV